MPHTSIVNTPKPYQIPCPLLVTSSGDTQESLDFCKCPADRVPAASGPGGRSYSMNGFVGGTTEPDTYGLT